MQTFRDDEPADYARTLTGYVTEGATLADILSNDRLEAIRAQLAARVEKAALDGIETFH